MNTKPGSSQAKDGFHVVSPVDALKVDALHFMHPNASDALQGTTTQAGRYYDS